MSAKSRCICCVLVVLIAMRAAIADVPRAQPTLVAKLPGSIPATLFYERLENLPQQQAQRATYPDKRLAMVDRLPLETTKLRHGVPSLVVADGLASPLFVIGLDASSFRWFEENLGDLRKYGARGLVIAAPSKLSWEEFRDSARARGVDVQLMDEDVLIEGYGLESFPVLIVGSVDAGSEATR